MLVPAIYSGRSFNYSRYPYAGQPQSRCLRALTPQRTLLAALKFRLESLLDITLPTHTLLIQQPSSRVQSFHIKLTVRMQDNKDT